ncbi:MAG: histidinol dehydrogenase [Verrucomicrobia bacterium RIFCSPLOWO2_12_FULL_64_8]|nr:MAG: histidinol dehydrogenase [Verrucomicrobia bacterium RIFCSPLOWO2_12_FULL_64_8]
MRTLRYGSRDFDARLAEFCQSAAPAREMRVAVASILADVRARGDAAIIGQAARIDGVRLTPSRFRVNPPELLRAAKSLPVRDRLAIAAARANVLACNRPTLPRGWMGRNRQGARVGEKFDPIRRVGINIPGGQVPLVSTVVMTVTLAQIAGVPEIAVFTPCDRHGRVAAGLLAALHLCGVTEVYRVGGVYGVGAMAYGTKTIPAVDKIFGPSNAWVCEAMRQVFGTVGVGGLPGPSELMVVADGTARPAYAAADLLAQAEHGSGKEKIFLVALSRRILVAIAGEVERQLARLDRAALIRRVVRDGFLAVEVGNLAEAAAVANHIAPEHLELLVGRRSAARLLRQISTAGAIMIGNDTPTALGDFTAGPSHVLPTGRNGRYFSGLRVADFMRRTSLVQYDQRSLRLAAPVVAAFSAMERLAAHGRSVEIRLM